MPHDIVLSLGEGYDPRTAPTVQVDVFGTVYRARKPKDSAVIKKAEFQMKVFELRNFGAQAEATTSEEDGTELLAQMRAKLDEMRQDMRELALSMLSEQDADDIMRRMFDLSEAAQDVGIGTVLRMHELVQEHFGDDISADYAEMGLQAPEPVKKTAKKTAAKKTTARRQPAKAGAKR